MIWDSRILNLLGVTIGMEWSSQKRDWTVLGNCDWHLLYGLIYIHVLHVQSSDNYILFISCHNQERDFMPRKKIFRYEANWTKKKYCKDIIKKAWGSSLAFSSKVETTKKSR